MAIALTPVRRKGIRHNKENRWDQAVIALTRRGFTAQTIADHTGLSIAQVRARQQTFGVRTMDWRRGKGVDAQAVLRGLDSMYQAIQELKKAGYTR